MGKLSVVILPDTTGHVNLIGDPCQAGDYRGFVGGLHTFAIHLNDFRGRLYFQGSLVIQPTEDDWFALRLNDEDFLEYPRIPNSPTGNAGDTGAEAYSVRSHLMWVRVRLDRTFTSNPNNAGTIRQILMSY